MNRYRAVVDAFLFNVCWFANAYGARRSNLWIGTAVVAVSLCVHLLLVDSPRREGVFVMIVATLGYLLDSSFHRVGVLHFEATGPFGLAPSWLFFQWGAFALLFDRSLRWLEDRPCLASLLGLVGGPASYYGATNFGILNFGDPLLISIGIFSLTWAVLFPALLLLGKSFSSTTQPTQGTVQQ